VVRLVASDFLVEEEIITNEKKVNISPTMIYNVVLAADSPKGLHSLFGLDAKADH